MDWFFDAILTWLAQAVVAALTGLFGLLSASVFSTPDVTALPQVADMSRRALTVVNVSFVLAILVAGITVMTKDTVQAQYGVGELGPRLVIGFVAANFATPICRELITLANALTSALTGDSLGGNDAINQMRTHVLGAGSSMGTSLLALIIGLLIAVLAAMLLVSWIVRIAVVMILVAIAPAALACHGLPFTEPAARLWWRALLGCLAIPMLQAVTLFTAIRVFLTTSANLPALGLPGLGDPASLINALVLLCLLWMVVKIPSLMRRYVTRGSGQNMAGSLARVLIAQQVSRGLRGRLRRGRPAPTTGGPDVATTQIPYWKPRLPRPTPATPATRATATKPAAATTTLTRAKVPPGVTPATVRAQIDAATGRNRTGSPAATGLPGTATTRATTTRATTARSAAPGSAAPGSTASRPAPARGRPTGTGWPTTPPTPPGRPRPPATGWPTRPALGNPRHGGRDGR